MTFQDPTIHPSQITPREIAEDRRQWLKNLALGGAIGNGIVA